MHQPIDLSPIIPNPRKRRGILPPMSHLQAAYIARTKLCPVCLQTKSRTDFAPRRDGEGGRRWYCRKCRWKAPRWKAAWESMRKGLRDTIGHVTAYDDLALVAAVTRRAVDYFGSVDRLLDAMHGCLTSGNLTDRETMRVMMGFAVMMHQAEIAGKILNGTGEAFVPKAPPKRRGKPRPSRSKDAMAARRAERRAMNMGLPLPAGTGAGANAAAQGAGLEQLIAELAAGPDCDYVDPADLAAPDRSGVGTFNPAEDFSPFYLETARQMEEDAQAYAKRDVARLLGEAGPAAAGVPARSAEQGAAIEQQLMQLSDADFQKVLAAAGLAAVIPVEL